MAAGTVYLLHFNEPYKHARHYVGWTARNVKRRLAEHEDGRGARLLAVVRAAGPGNGRSNGRAATPGTARCAACGLVACPATPTGHCRGAAPPTPRSSPPG